MMNTRHLGIVDYHAIWMRMKEFTSCRNEDTPDEIWLLEHYPVYTQGQAGKPEHILNPNAIQIIHSDRGGQVTYHGPGQLVVYVLMDIRRRNLGIRTLVCQLEQVIISVLEYYQIKAHTLCGAPGVYVEDKKIASIGLRVKNGRTYHGIALNVNMDLTPFSDINPCGFEKMQMTQMSHSLPNISVHDVSYQFQKAYLNQFK